LDNCQKIVDELSLIKPKDITDERWEQLNSKNNKGRIANMLEYEYGGRVLEIGSCEGFLSIYLCKLKPGIKKYIGLEIDEKLVAVCKRLASHNGIKIARYIQGDGCIMQGLEGQLFDTIILAEVLEHMRKPLDMLKRAYAALSPGGNVIITVPGKGVMPPGRTPGHVQDFSVDDMKTMLSEAGFKLLHRRRNHLWEFYLAIKPA